MNIVKTFRDLLVWQKSHLLVLEIYKITQKFPSEEKFGLVSQLRRSVSTEDFNELNLRCDEVGRILYGFQKKLSN